MAHSTAALERARAERRQARAAELDAGILRQVDQLGGRLEQGISTSLYDGDQS